MKIFCLKLIFFYKNNNFNDNKLNLSKDIIEKKREMTSYNEICQLVRIVLFSRNILP